MNLFRYIQSLRAQKVETENMLNLVGNHPIMSVGLRERLNELNRKIEELPSDVSEPKVQLLFSGLAVMGNSGIKSSFLGKTLKAFQEMVKTQAALIRYGNVAERGKAKRGANADLYITALPTGSFGVELTQLQHNDLFEEQEVGRAIHEVMELIEHVCSSESDYEEAIMNTPKRNISNLKAFFKEVSDEESMIKMQSGNFQVEAPYDLVLIANSRLSSIESLDEEIFINGLFRGALLDSGKFEITADDGTKYSGLIGEDVEEDTIINYDQTLINHRCRFHLMVHNITFSNGNTKTTYELLEISPIQDMLSNELYLE